MTALTTVPAMYRRSLREVTRVLISTTFVPLLLPVFMLTIFARVFSAVVNVPGFAGSTAYAGYITPAVILMAVMLGSPTAGISTAVEIQTGFYDRMRMSPAGVGPSMLARRLADATRLAGFVLILLVAARIDGVSVRNWPLALLVSVTLGAWWGVAYGGVALSVCLKTGSAELAQALIPLFFPILFMSTAFMPLQLLPGWLQGIARYNPVSYLCDVIRGALSGHVPAGALWRALLGIVMVTAFTQFLVWRAGRASDAA